MLAAKNASTSMSTLQLAETAARSRISGGDTLFVPMVSGLHLSVVRSSLVLNKTTQRRYVGFGEERKSGTVGQWPTSVGCTCQGRV